MRTSPPMVPSGRRRLLLPAALLAAVLGLAVVGVLAWAVLTPPRLLLTVESRPSGAEIWMNEQYLGVSPIELDLSDQVHPRSRPDIPHPFPLKQGCHLNVMWEGRPGDAARRGVIEMDCYLRTTLAPLWKKEDGGERFLVLREWGLPRLRFHARVDGMEDLDFDRAPEVVEEGLRTRRVRLDIHIDGDKPVLR